MSDQLNTRCFFRYDDGSYCKRWAQCGFRFCYNHQPQGEAGPHRYGYGSGHAAGDWPQLHPHARLATPSDLFDFVREALNAARMGAIPPNQLAGISSLVALWLKLYEKLRAEDRVYALSSQIIPTLVDTESAAHEERLQRQTEENDKRMQLEAELDYIVRTGEDPPAAGAESIAVHARRNGDVRGEIPPSADAHSLPADAHPGGPLARSLVAALPQRTPTPAARWPGAL